MLKALFQNTSRALIVKEAMAPTCSAHERRRTAACAAPVAGASPAYPHANTRANHLLSIHYKRFALMVAVLLPAVPVRCIAETNAPGAGAAPAWNWHVQNTVIFQGHPAFPAPYAGPNSLDNAREGQETLSLDFLAGMRLWQGAEAHVDALVWQGHGLSDTVGLEGFPNGEGSRVGTDWPNMTLARCFIRQTIGLGGAQEKVEEDLYHLAGPQDVARLTLTLGKFSVKDIFDGNRYANDPRTQFLNWALMANEAWDIPADALGFTTGCAAELNAPQWTLRYGLFQMPASANGLAMDTHYLAAWGMVTELERRYSLGGHPGAVRVLAFLNRADMGSYQEAVDDAARPADIEATRAYRYKYGGGLNFEQEITPDLGAFSRLGWSDGHTEAWAFSDVDRTATLGVQLKGSAWNRADDAMGLAGALNGLSNPHRQFLAAGGTGILAGDGMLHYGAERLIETYYDLHVWQSLHTTFDYQFFTNPACNQDRGPVSVFSLRMHLEF